MKKTIIALMALSGVVSADWYTGNDANLYEVTGNVDTVTTMGDAQNVTSDYQIKAKELSGTNSTRQATIGEYILRGGKKVVLMDRWQTDSTNIDVTINKLTIETVGNATSGNVTINAAQKLTVNSINGTLGTLELAGGSFTVGGILSMEALSTSAAGSTVNFGTSNSINTGTSGLGFAISTGASLTLGAVLTDAQIEELAAGNNVSRDLIVTNKLNNVTSLSTLSNALNLSLVGATVSDGGLIYSVTANDVTTYYNIEDVTVNNSGYATVNNGATALELASNTAYLVVGGIANNNASLKKISYLVTVPEPTTATLSLLALAGLAARRRRR